ncbi:FtsK/SpoIIIE family protein, putative secretion system component EssC/YukA [Streptococcus cristatus]|uniref:FtsK/SpoIIIE family protein, putative secretion system component EssC/YukA n=2 Tax=Streptococcus cristatus TaxID=45634 RepID=A0A139N5M2_STRCR|nr:FtsK/SpoIIIE family protein, putative secretion system component EssC/YukA [Streptococcus cristatus]
MEMLHTPDAAEITQTGRAYLQVGNNEVYELFQSAWSGADYQPDKDDMGIEDHTIYLINELGQYEILNEDLSGLEEADEIKEVPTELDAIVQNIKLLTESQRIAPVPQPWLPPLRERITLEELEPINFQNEWAKEPSDLNLLLGMADMPQQQAQEVASINLTRDGNVLLYGSPGTGKTTFLQSTAMDLARKHSPKDLTLYLLDFGTNGLAPLANLPHVADTLLLDQSEKVAKFVRIMESELNRRKKLLSEYGVGTIALYREASGKEEPTIVVLLDSFESVKEEPFGESVFQLLVKLSREGLSLGIHVIMTASRQNNIRVTLYSNFKHQLTLKQNDLSEAKTIVGSSSDPLVKLMEDIKGRALMQREALNSVQLALPVAGDNDIQVINNLRNRVQELNEAWTGETPQAIPMVPEELTQYDFYNRKTVKEAYDKGLLPLGLDMETVEAVTWNLAKGNLLYLNEKEEQMTEFLEQISRSQQKVIVLAPQYHRIPAMDGVTMIADSKDYLKGLGSLEKRIQERLEQKEQEHVATLVVYNMRELVGELEQDAIDSLARVLDRGLRSGYGSIVMSDPLLNNRIDAASKIARTFKQGLLGVRVADQSILSVNNRPPKEGHLEEQAHYYIADSIVHNIKVMML